MKKFKKFGQQYVDWVIKLGRIKFSLFGFFILAIFALFVQCLLSFSIVGTIYWQDVIRSISFGLISAPFTIYFFTLLVEKLELSRVKLADSVTRLKKLRERDSELNQQLSENITKLHKTQTELVQQAEFLRSFIDASPDLVFYRSEEGMFLGCNRAFEKLVGKSEREIINLSLSDIFPPEIERYMESIDRDTLQTNDGVTYEQWFKYPNGKSACFEIRKVPYFDRIKKRHCIMGFGRDITAHKHYQEMIEKASRDKTTLMATISHELRTPLNAIVGLSRILLDGKLSEEQRNYLKTINISAVSLGHIFSDIIDLEKIDARRIKLAKTEIDLQALINDISNFGHLMAEQKKLLFKIQYDSSLSDWVMLDRARLSQILWNLINNAVKFTQQGEIILSIYRAENKLYFKISDTGIGIEQKELVRIFAMYYQIKSPSQSHIMGSGIGLSISKRLAKLMGGDLTVESEVGKGSIFTLEIPYEKAIKPSEKNLLKIIPKLHILLVEDIDINIVVAKSLLEKLGYSVDVAKTGKVALEKFEQENYDLVFLDIQLPDMTGFDIAQYLREKYIDGKYDYLPPLIALTANMIQNKQEYLQKGMDDVLRKPLSLDSLTQCLFTYFGEEATEPEKSIDAENNFITDNEIFNNQMLNELIEMLGVKFVLDNLILFKKMMKTYISELYQLFQAYQNNSEKKLEVISLAHKIKGAAASVGLLRIQNIAQQAQNGGIDWESNIANWITQIELYWLSDVEKLEEKLSCLQKANES